MLWKILAVFGAVGCGVLLHRDSRYVSDSRYVRELADLRAQLAGLQWRVERSLRSQAQDQALSLDDHGAMGPQRPTADWAAQVCRPQR